MTIEEYWEYVREYLSSTNGVQRPGQAAMNVLWSFREDLWNQIVGTGLDPFESDKPLNELFAYNVWLNQHWDL